MLRPSRLSVIFFVLFLLHRPEAFCAAQEVAPNGTVYEVFVRSFASSKPNQPGDLPGLLSKLDYLNDGKPDSLQVGVLWLMPIFPSQSYHGYDVTDFRNVNPDYGTLDDLKGLVVESHKRHVRVILDIPFNHTSREHPWFKAALNNPQDPHRSWYFIFPDDGHIDTNWHTVTTAGGEHLKYFGLFGDSMPDLNYDTDAVPQEVKDIAKFWLSAGVDGFRLDAAKHIYGWSFSPNEADILGNNRWWREFSDSVHATKSDAVLVGEVLGEERVLVRHAWGLDALLDEPLMNEMRSEIERPYPGFVGHWKDFVTKARAENPNKPYDSFLFLSSHDQNPRLESKLELDMGPAAGASYRLGLSIMMSLGKHPILYEGDELGQRGWRWNGNASNDSNGAGDGSGVYDETLREPLPWHKTKTGSPEALWEPPNHAGFLPKFELPNDAISVDEESADDSSLLGLTRGLTAFRQKNPTFANGDIGDIITDTQDWLVFEKVQNQDADVVLINPTAQGNTYRFYDKWYPKYANAQLEFWTDGRLKQWKDLSGQNQRIAENVFVPPYGMVVLHP